MKLWEQALNNLKEGCRDLHHEYIESQAKIVTDFIKTSHAYIKQLEQDYDEKEYLSVKGGYGGSD